MKLTILCTAVLFVFACTKESEERVDCITPHPQTDDCIDPSKINDTAFCSMIYAPVCGCNGVTYDNACVAETSGVTSWKEGKCCD